MADPLQETQTAVAEPVEETLRQAITTAFAVVTKPFQVGHLLGLVRGAVEAA